MERAPHYSFFQLVELLHRLHGDDLERDALETPTFSRLRFTACGSLGFPASDVRRARRTIALSTGMPCYWVEVNFFGLQGAQSPLPGFYLESLAHEYAHREGALGDFLNFFNHRLLSQLHLMWRKYRYYVRFQDGGQDGFSRAVFSLFGLGDERLRHDSTVNWSKMLAYTGLLAGRSRSPQVVSGIVAHCFDLEEVEIEQFKPRWIEIPPDQRTALGGANAALGISTVAGERVSDIGSKFALCFKNLSLDRFKDFLPNGKDFTALSQLMDMTMREQLAFDLELELKPHEIKPMQLGDGTSCQLGWTTFVNPDTTRPLERVRIQIRR
nr:type VI secretion system baseplate subunit TssG [Larsenimonas suaedae]